MLESAARAVRDAGACARGAAIEEAEALSLRRPAVGPGNAR
jgi:hypothetical protein